jgi:schlafen family protein
VKIGQSGDAHRLKLGLHAGAPSETPLSEPAGAGHETSEIGCVRSAVLVDELAEGHLRALVDDAVAEGRSLEFKESVGTNDEAKREFLYDVSSFANGPGGDLLLGVKEEDGVATALPGLPAAQADTTILRLENLLRDGIEPRIPAVRMRPVAIDADKIVLVIRVPRSWSAPHMVTFQGLSRFYSRHSAGKYRLDVREIRAAFAASEGPRTFVRSFRSERLARLVADEGPVALLPNPKTVLHIIPLSASDPAITFDVMRLGGGAHSYFRPLYGTAWNWRINFDGVLAYAGDEEGGDARSYTQVFRNGILEGVEAVLPRRTCLGEKHKIPSLAFEKTLIEGLDLYAQLSGELGIAGPFAIALSLLDVRGLQMAVDARYFESGQTIDRDNLLTGETVVDDLPPPDQALKPHFDAVWNAAGWSGSLNYDDDGRWHDR